MKRPSPEISPEAMPPPRGSVKAHLKQAVPITFFACSWERAQEEVRRQRACDWWVYDWPQVDYDWLFGGARVPLSDYSPLARRYYDQIAGELSSATSQAYSQCESRHYAPQSEPDPGLRLSVSSRLTQGGAKRGSAKPDGIGARVSVPFAAGASPPPPASCPMLRRELFANPVDFC